MPTLTRDRFQAHAKQHPDHVREALRARDAAPTVSVADLRAAFPGDPDAVFALAELGVTAAELPKVKNAYEAGKAANTPKAAAPTFDASSAFYGKAPEKEIREAKRGGPNAQDGYDEAVAQLPNFRP